MSLLPAFIKYIDSANATTAAMRAHPTPEFTQHMEKAAVTKAGLSNGADVLEQTATHMYLYIRALARGGHHEHAFQVYNLLKKYRPPNCYNNFWDISVNTELNMETCSLDSLHAITANALVAELERRDTVIEDRVNTQRRGKFLCNPATTLGQMLKYGKDNNLTTAKMLELRGDPDDAVAASRATQYEFMTATYQSQRATVNQVMREFHAAFSQWRTEAYSD